MTLCSKCALMFHTPKGGEFARPEKDCSCLRHDCGCRDYREKEQPTEREAA